MAIMPSTSATSCSSSSPSSAASMPRWTGSMPAWTSRRTMGAKWRSRSSVSISSRRSLAASWEGSTMALRETRNRAQVAISMPGKSMSRFSTMRSSRVTKVVLAVHLDQALGDVLGHRDLDPRHVGLAAAGEAERHQQVERQVGDEGEGVGRVHGQRRDHGEDVGGEGVAQALLGLGGQVLDLDQADALGLQQGHQVVEDALLVGLDLADHRQAVADLLGGRAPVHRRGMHPGGDLLLEAPDALHEELIEVVADDGQELDPLQQGVARVVGLVQDAPVEGEPGQLAVEVEGRGVEIDRVRLSRLRRAAR